MNKEQYETITNQIWFKLLVDGFSKLYTKHSLNIKDMCLTTATDSHYTWTDGTSFSAPKVSAVAALIICNNNDITPKKLQKNI
jgi:subtilisin family serine protease